MNQDEFLKGYKQGLKDGKKDALLEFQKENPLSELPSNETLYKIFKLLFECQKNDIETSSCYMNTHEHYANYITKHWNE